MRGRTVVAAGLVRDAGEQRADDHRRVLPPGPEVRPAPPAWGVKTCLARSITCDRPRGRAAAAVDSIRQMPRLKAATRLHGVINPAFRFVI